MPRPAKGCRRWAVPDRCLRRETATEGVMAACAAEEDTAEAHWGPCRAVGSTTTMRRRHETNGPCKYGILKGACSEHVEKFAGKCRGSPSECNLRCRLPPPQVMRWLYMPPDDE